MSELKMVKPPKTDKECPECVKASRTVYLRESTKENKKGTLYCPFCWAEFKEVFKTVEDAKLGEPLDIDKLINK